MCGICGIINLDKQPVDKDVLLKMTRVLSHRGPDDEGFYISRNVGLGNRRLSVIDLENGHQPISNENSSIWVIQNGEIYNFHELRKETEAKGHKYKTSSDTEVIVHLYEEYGEQFTKKLNGMFAIAIWDEKKRKLVLARDRIGIKPLYYYYDSQKLIFASEIKALINEPRLNREVDICALSQYLAYRFVPAPQSMLKGIKKLLPGHILVLDRNGDRIEKYWDLEYKETKCSEKHYFDKFDEIFSRAVKRHLISDVPIGVFLSGGVDSSLIVGMASKLQRERVKTFSISFDDEKIDESKYMRIVSRQYNTDHHELIVSPDNIDLLSKLIWHMDEPLGDESLLPTYCLSEYARKYVTVALAGDGGDELFAGYDRYRHEKIISYYSRIPRFIREIAWTIGKFTTYKDKISYLNRNSVLSPDRRYQLSMEIIPEQNRNELIGQLNHGSSDNLMKYYDRIISAGNIERMLYVDMKAYLPNDLLLKVDQMSMAHSLEVRVPFLDHEVVDFARSLPMRYKLRGFNGTKYLLRKYLSKQLPASIYARGKRGFNVPVDSWFRNKLKTYAYDILLGIDFNKHGIFDKKAMERILDEHQKGASWGAALWALIVFQLWHKQFVSER